MPLIVTPGFLTHRGELYHQFASLLTAGVGIVQALEMLAKSPPSRGDRRPLQSVGARVSQGSTLHEAFRAAGNWLPEFDLALIQAAEESGRLPECFRLLSNHYNERALLARRILQDLLYPLFILHFAVLIFPTSQLTALVRNFDPLPFLLGKVAMLLPLYAGTLLLLYAGQSQRSEPWRALVERILHLVPLVGTSRRFLALSRLASSLGALIRAGVQIIEAWMLAANACGSPALKREVAGWRRRLESGSTPGDILTLDSSFPTLFANLYRTGEVSGQLDDTLDRLYHHYQEEGSRKLHLVAQWLPRLIYLLILVAVAIQIVQFWTGYYDNLFRQISE